MNVDNIKHICLNFRKALEQAKNPPSYLPQFPTGWCGATSRAIGVYLLQQGYQDVKYVSGSLDNKSHAWIEVQDYIVDITADQFSNCQEQIIVSKQCSFHEIFTNIEKRFMHASDTDTYPENWILKIATEYL